MSDNILMTVEEFDSALKKWADKVKGLSRITLNQTHSSGELWRELHDYVDPLQDQVSRRIAFKFPRHGVFRHYGAGRGYVIINGKPVKGYRVLSLREIQEKRTNQEALDLLKKGYSYSFVKKNKKTYDNDKTVARKPLNWLDSHIASNFQTLADIASEFYGDQCLEQLLKQVQRIQIVKVKI